MRTSLTHAHEGGLVVFNIGMTIRRPHRVDAWLPVFAAMPRLLRELYANRDAVRRGESVQDLGFLGATGLMSAQGPWVTQYWRSVDHLYAYAHAQNLEHVPAWRAFNAAARRNPKAVGIWHETFAVPEGGVETLYANGALTGLGAATGVLPVGRRGTTARERLTRSGRRPR